MNTISKTDQKSHIIKGEIFYCPNEAHSLKPEVPYKKAVKVLLDNYATENNFSITTFRSDKQKLYYKYQKGGSYRNIRDLNEDNRK